MKWIRRLTLSGRTATRGAAVIVSDDPRPDRQNPRVDFAGAGGKQATDRRDRALGDGRPTDECDEQPVSGRQVDGAPGAGLRHRTSTRTISDVP
jgi:hypothetical protein